jgi:hypothetical protein
MNPGVSAFHPSIAHIRDDDALHSTTSEHGQPGEPHKNPIHWPFSQKNNGLCRSPTAA